MILVFATTIATQMESEIKNPVEIKVNKKQASTFSKETRIGTNTYIAPSVTLDSKGNKMLGLGLKFRF